MSSTSSTSDNQTSPSLSSLPVLTNYINGAFVPAHDNRTLDDYDPATHTVHALIPRSTDIDIQNAVEAATMALPIWSKVSVTERAAALDRIANEIERRAEELAMLEAIDSGKTLKMALTVDIPRTVANFRFYAGQVRHDYTHTHQMHDAINYDIRTPVGVCGLITPWNLPLYLLSWKVAPALACGNTVIAKPSEITPRTASVLAEIIHNVGKLPNGVFNLVHGLGGEAGAALIAHPKVRAISFTGGTATGAIVARTAAPLFKKLSLELGGKNSTVIFADADMKITLPGAVRASFTNNGQICLAGSRIFVQRPLYDTFLPQFIEAVKQLKVGPPLDPQSDVGPLSSAMHRDKVISYIQLGKTEGGKIECGGDEPVYVPAEYTHGYFVSPTVISGLSPVSRVSTEEIFGPVATIHPFDTEEEVVGYVNNVRYGLAGSIWTTNIKTGHRIAHAIDSGIIWINCWLHRDLRTPFGGVKDSGLGREGGMHSLEFYSEYKNVCVHLGPP